MKIGALPIAAAGFLTLLPLSATTAAPEKVSLPIEADASTLAPLSETLLYGEEGIETQLPGPAEDEERITMSLGPDGVPRSIVVDQKLTIHGLGDFFFKVSGPAQDVTATAASEASPGLRRGSVLWQGFSEGKKVLAARMPLFVEQELARLPLETHLDLRVDGEPLKLGERASGDFEMTFTVINVSESLTSYTVGDGRPRELARALDAIDTVLEQGDRPVPGKGGVPRSVAVGPDPETVTEEIEMPFRVSGAFVFPSKRLTDIKVSGAGISPGTQKHDSVEVDALVGGGAPSRLSFRVTGRAIDMGYPGFVMTAKPAPPLPPIRPPFSKSWGDATRRGVAHGREMFDVLMRTMWQVAKLRTFDAYLGNPDPTGPARSVYRYRMAQPEPVVRAPVVDVTEVSPWTTAAAVVALLLLLFGLVRWWSVS
ncbi:MAG: hypothetical protein QOH26_257 [Actinomycetota bacterium]|nr:hypothetical protein [Actinomycetota bacterium]